MKHLKILLWWLAFICCGPSAVLSQSPPTVVYRGDMLTPEDLKLQGGFLPRGEDGTRPNQPPASLSLYNHVEGSPTGTGRYDTGYVSTTTSLDSARRFVSTVLGGHGYIYRIHVSANFIDVAGTLGQFYRHTDEAEVASLGRIQLSQVLGWTEVINGAEQSEVRNPQYDSRFDTASWGGSQPQLAGFPPNHRAWTLEPWRAFAMEQMEVEQEQAHPETQSDGPQVEAPDSSEPMEVDEEHINQWSNGQFNGASCAAVIAAISAAFSKHSRPGRSLPDVVLVARDKESTSSDCDRARDMATQLQRPQTSKSDEPLKDDELKKLENGDFSGFSARDCALALEKMYIKYKIHTPELGNKLGRRADTAEDPKADCRRAQDLLQKQKVPEPCKKIKNIEIGFTLSSSWLSIKGEGTKDDVGAILEGPAGKAELLLASQPSGGYSKWIPLDMQKSFKTDSIDITGINNLTLTAETFFIRGGESDAFKVQDLRLRAKCADPGFGAKNDKYVGINAWYERPQKGWWIFSTVFYPSNYDKKNLATFPVVPADWEFAPPCASFKELSYDFAFGNTNGGGTGDTLVLKLGEGKIPLGKSFTAGTSTKGTVDLEKTFKKKVVQLSELETVAFDDDDSTASFGDNGWTFKGVTFTATCADVPKKLQMNKYSNVNADIYAAGNKEPWSGKLIPSDWIELK
ncbi:hypothetical protein MY5147_009748 [Beauveria neobassiana]